MRPAPPLAVWSNGILAEVWHRKNPNYFVPIHHLPRANQTIEEIVDQPWTIQTLIDKEDAQEREGSKTRSLRELIMDMENEVLANAGVDVFEVAWWGASCGEASQETGCAWGNVVGLPQRPVGRPADTKKRHTRLR